MRIMAEKQVAELVSRSKPLHAERASRTQDDPRSAIFANERPEERVERLEHQHRPHSRNAKFLVEPTTP